ncbi:hypothetical protein [Bradyrhizobium sp.]|uniref:hypothetical protein n=1 Tax=Bradyrhizobium sp. TaxID=376 RepID=UPI003C3907AE
MTDVDAKEAASALSDIDDIVRRVRQSQIYNFSSRIMIWWGGLVLAGNVANYLWPSHGYSIWIAINIVGALGTVLISALIHRQTGRAHAFDGRMLMAYLLFFVFGYLCSEVFGHYGPRQLAAFWPIYFMLFYTLAGLWFGRAFVAIGLGISALTLIGYVFITGFAFLPWMALVNGGGLILGGIWMRRS